MEGKTRHRWKERLDTDGRKEEAKMGGKRGQRWEESLDSDGRKE